MELRCGRRIGDAFRMQQRHRMGSNFVGGDELDAHEPHAVVGQETARKGALGIGERQHDLYRRDWQIADVEFLRSKGMRPR